ncbi:MAG: HU family DNA-binding protein, partial [Alphaproteobacteria bacterium]
FNVQATLARKGRNPRTGAEIDIPAGNRITFKAGKEFKESVN